MTKNTKAKEQTLHDFEDGSGPVPAHQHPNPDGSVGGWVAETASVDATAYVGASAQVFGSARVHDSARVYGSAWVFDSARVLDSARVYGSAWVYGSARVYGSAQVSGFARVSDSAQVYGSAWVSDSAQVSGSAKITGHEYAHLGIVLGYTADTWLDKEDKRWLRYGCRLHLLDEWTKAMIAKLVNIYEPNLSKQYCRTLAALVALCNTLPGRE